MKTIKRPARSTTTRKTTSSRRGKKAAAMKARYIVSAAIIICAVIVGILASMGPKLGLQTNPIEPEAIAYLKKNNLLKPDEILEAYKAISYYTYNQGVVVTNKRIFVYDHSAIAHSIPLDSISMVIVKNSELGHQEVIVAAQQNGVIGVELYHTYVPTLIKLLGVPNSKVQDVTGNLHHSNKVVTTQKEATAKPINSTSK